MNIRIICLVAILEKGNIMAMQNLNNDWLVENHNKHQPEFPADEVDDAEGDVVICWATGEVSIELRPPVKYHQQNQNAGNVKTRNS